ncbi:PAS domain-containing sensor histidine kinase, partial [Sinorhizobium meliloti]
MADARRGSAAEGRLRLKFPGFSGLEREFIEQAKIFAEPASQKLAMAEPMLKRSIPVLIIAFLLIVAISRMSGIMDEHAR